MSPGICEAIWRGDGMRTTKLSRSVRVARGTLTRLIYDAGRSRKRGSVRMYNEILEAINRQSDEVDRLRAVVKRHGEARP